MVIISISSKNYSGRIETLTPDAVYGLEGTHNNTTKSYGTTYIIHRAHMDLGVPVSVCVLKGKRVGGNA